jgi:hypothetical protein
MIFPEYVATTANVLLKHRCNGVGFVYSDSILVDKDGTKVEEGHSNKFDIELLQSKSYIPGCAATLTEALKMVLPLDEAIKVGTKVHRWRKIVAQGFSGTYISEPLFYYRMHDHNTSGIGKRVLADVSKGVRNPLLSGYWQS